MRCLLTGVTGFVGRVVAAQLTAGGHQVSGLVRDPAKAADLEAAGVGLRSGDVTDRASVTAAVEGAEAVVHLAAWYQVGARNDRAEEINVGGTRNVLEAAWRAGASRIVHVSSLAVNSDTHGLVRDESFRFEGRHLSEYDRTKWMAHYEVAVPLAESGAPVLIVQPGLIYGPGDESGMGRLVRDWLAGRSTPYGASSAYNWGHVEDTARGIISAMEQGRTGQSYIIAGPRHMVTEAFDIASSITGLPAPRLKAPSGMLAMMAAVLGGLSKVVPALAGQAELMRVAPATYLGDSAKAGRELGFGARSLEEGFGELLPMIRAGAAA
jgi:nucleoside-diphosphate-sugar epimerase